VLREWSGPRAQLLSVPCFAATLALVVEHVEGGPARRLWWCVPIQLLWTQLHGGNPTGVALLSLGLLAAPSLEAALVTGSCAIATVLGPYGIWVHAHFLGAHAALPNIREWEPLSVALTAGSAAHWMVLVLGFLAVLTLRGQTGAMRWFSIGALVVFGAVAFRYQRFALEASMVAAVILSPTLAGWSKKSPRVLLFALTAAITAGAAWSSERKPGIGLEPSRFPTNAVAWLKAHHPVGPMFNSYNYGGYLLWAWPEQKVFIDGRAFTVYEDTLVSALPAIYADPKRFADLEARYGFRLAVLQRMGRGAGLVEWLRHRPDWYPAYEDAMTVIFVRGIGLSP
jgi:hypothetical protein